MSSLSFAPSPKLRFALTGVFGAPEVSLPWMDRFLEPDELLLVQALAAAGPLTPPAAAGAIAAGSARHVGPSFFDRCERRGIIDRPTPEVIALADFATRFDIWCLFEGWMDLPQGACEALAAWRLGLYVDDKRQQVERLVAGGGSEPGLENAEYLLLHEAEALIGRAAHVYLWPCDCRALFGRCDKPTTVCLRFENDRDLGWEISRERAIAVLREADAAGLTHTGETAPLEATGYQPIEQGAICNCCADCCFPHLAGEALGAVKVWPRARYIARRDPDVCTLCGRCARRCPFGAVSAVRRRRSTSVGDAASGEATVSRTRSRHVVSIAFDEAGCRGCGLCATGCPERAIAMEPLEA